ncbi:MAG: hypothetical protein PVTTEEND_001599 [Candidatus Fervidibacter sp.]|jgi:hypothetical protein
MTVTLLTMWGVAMLRRHTPTPRPLPALQGEAVLAKDEQGLPQKDEPHPSRANALMSTPIWWRRKFPTTMIGGVIGRRSSLRRVTATRWTMTGSALTPSWRKAVHLRDIHLEKGMHCVDCHFSQDVHGNGKLYGEVRNAIEISCTECHGTLTKTYPQGFEILDIANLPNKGFSERIVTAPVSPKGQRLFVNAKNARYVGVPTTQAVDPTQTRLPENEEQPIHLLYGFLYVADAQEGLIVILPSKDGVRCIGRGWEFLLGCILQVIVPP